MSHINHRQWLIAALYWGIGLVGMLVAATWASAPFDLRVLEAQTERTQVTGFVYGQERFSQIVQVPHDGLAAVRFWLLAHRRDTDGSITLHVATPDKPTHDLAAASILLRDLPSQPPVTFNLPPFDRVTTPVLILTLEAPKLDRAHAISLMGSGNRYGGGMLLVNGKIRPAEDLAFQLLTLRTQGDRLLPISQLALNRPGIFGQPWLYVALLWSMLWAYGWVVIKIVRWPIDTQYSADKASSSVI